MAVAKTIGTQAMLGGSCGVVETLKDVPARSSEVACECGRIDSNLERMYAKVDYLRDRLGTVLRPPDTLSGDSPKEQYPATELGQRLRNFDTRLDGMCDMLEDILQRLEV